MGNEEPRSFFQDVARANPVGEVWFTFGENETSLGVRLDQLLADHPEILGSAADPSHPGICPLLMKLLFTTERLSVQVHPDDEYAQQRHGSLGKTEAWYVVDSQAPGEVAVGFRQALTPEQLKAAAESGEIEDLLDWRRVSAGDTVFVPAGTVHAIGAGLTICEIQQNSDITYRLYDYGRGRELHLEDGVKVSNPGRHEFDESPRRLAEGRDELITSAYFRIERLCPRKVVRIRREFGTLFIAGLSERAWDSSRAEIAGGTLLDGAGAYPGKYDLRTQIRSGSSPTRLKSRWQASRSSNQFLNDARISRAILENFET